MTLTPRQVEVFNLICAGLTDAEIAILLGISKRTAGWHVQTLLDKTGMSRRIELINWFGANKRGLLAEEKPPAKLLEQLAQALAIVSSQENYILLLQRKLAEHGIPVPEPEKQ